MSLIETIRSRAKADKKTIVLPEAAMDERTARAAAGVLRDDVANLMLIGKEDKIKALANGADLSKATFIDPENYEKIDAIAESLYNLRKSKGMTLDEAKQTLLNPLSLGVMMVKDGIADGMVAGAVSSSANVLRPALQLLKTAPGAKIVSSFFIMVVPECDLGNNGVFLFSDCAVVQNPNAEELAAIAVSSAESYKLVVGGEPTVALLSYSTMGSAAHADVDKVVEATKIAKESAPHLKIDGELQADAAIIREVGKAKSPDSPVAGEANVLVFPNLDAANIGYKLVQRLAKAEAYGPIIQGLPKPVNDLSRGCSSEDIEAVVAITAIQAQNIK